MTDPKASRFVYSRPDDFKIIRVGDGEPVDLGPTDEENGNNDMHDRARGALLGLAVGDAVGTTVEFKPRGTFRPLTDMVGGGPFGLAPGEWTDDTSMALALADSLAACGGLDEQDLMTRFVAWWRRGEYSHNGRCFDIGATTASALSRFERNGTPIAGDTRPDSAGNGSLMRLAPVALWGVRAGEATMRDVARRQSATTHGAIDCLDACEAYAAILLAALRGASLPEAVERGAMSVSRLSGLLNGAMATDRGSADVQSTGYVLHTLDAAIWCVAHTGNFADAVLLAANLGDDADTTAAVAGQLAGALHGASAIPLEWLETLVWRERIEAAAMGAVGI